MLAFPQIIKSSKAFLSFINQIEETVAQDTTQEYILYLQDLAAPSVPFCIHATAFYLVEAVYNSAWSNILSKQGTGGKYTVYASRWYTYVLYILTFLSPFLNEYVFPGAHWNSLPMWMSFKW